MLNAVIKH